MPRALSAAVLGGILVAAALVRLRLAGVPLERDEGEYAYAGQLILQGVPPYQLVYNMKFPGVYYAYSLILALCGQTPWGIHVGLMLVNAATTLLLFDDLLDDNGDIIPDDEPYLVIPNDPEFWEDIHQASVRTTRP